MAKGIGRYYINPADGPEGRQKDMARLRFELRLTGAFCQTTQTSQAKACGPSQLKQLPRQAQPGASAYSSVVLTTALLRRFLIVEQWVAHVEVTWDVAIMLSSWL